MIIVSLRAINFFGKILGMKPAALAFFPFIFIHPDVTITDELINHEKIHLRQQLELLILPFYVWYLISYFKVGYMAVSFEREAYANDKNLNYLKSRRLWAFLKY